MPLDADCDSDDWAVDSCADGTVACFEIDEDADAEEEEEVDEATV
jgi:hypothetical protein